MTTIQDTGLICPQCGYNLTGLDEPHCPECGGRFSWQEVQEYVRRLQPTIAFEKRQKQVIFPFLVTWLTMLFAPWIFAKQACQHIRIGQAMMFSTLFFALFFLSDLMNGDFGIEGLLFSIGTIIFIVIQSIWLSLADDPGFYYEGSTTYGFWLGVSIYASFAIIYPMLELAVLTDFILEYHYRIYNHYHEIIKLSMVASIVLIWIILGCCYYQRWKTPRNFPEIAGRILGALLFLGLHGFIFWLIV